MKLQVMCVQERANSYVGKKGQVNERILTLLDQDAHLGQVIPGTFDYVLSAEESAVVPVNGLLNKPVVIGISEITQWNGRPRFRGKLDVAALNGGLKK